MLLSSQLLNQQGEKAFYNNLEAHKSYFQSPIGFFIIHEFNYSLEKGRIFLKSSRLFKRKSSDVPILGI